MAAQETQRWALIRVLNQPWVLRNSPPLTRTSTIKWCSAAKGAWTSAVQLEGGPLDGLQRMRWRTRWPELAQPDVKAGPEAPRCKGWITRGAGAFRAPAPTSASCHLCIGRVQPPSEES